MSEYLDGDLASSGRERMERHVGECRDCRTVLGELRLMIERLGRLPSPEAGGAVRITAAVRLRLREPPRS
jgi:anti-sigma factor RsiW